MDSHSLTLLEDDESPYIALLAPTSQRRRRRPIIGVIGIAASVMFLLSLVGLVIHQNPTTSSEQPKSETSISPSPSPVNPEKTPFSNESSSSSYNWTNAMYAWQRTAFHFQPEKNWMNDPDGPLYHLGWYHLFYQYNPFSAVWGNITWGHAVSRDLIHWLYLPIAMYPDQWYDFNGTWTGSATILPNGTIVMLYTGATAPSVQVRDEVTYDLGDSPLVQVQCLAYPANQSDPLLLNWTKYDNNPVIVPPKGIEADEFRDPTTAWMGPDGTWRITIGTKVNDTGMALIYSTTNFTTYEAADNVLHAVDGTGMWECVDFYPVSTNSSQGLDTSTAGPDIKHVLKASLDDLKQDYYAIGTYDPVNDTWTPDNPAADVGIGLMVDYGRYYASKTFFDQNTSRRILWGWINETDSASDDLKKGWASVQTIPRTVTYDNETGMNILQWPVEEIESLRLNNTEFEDVELGPGSVVALDIGTTTQLDIIAEFEISTEALEVLGEREYGTKCGTAYNRSTLGPFGLAVLATESFSELTPVYFHIAKNSSGGYQTFFCIDETRSSKAPESEVFKEVYGGPVTVLDGEKFTMRILVDHSIIEGFAQGGRTVITSRVYPTEAIYGAAKLYLFNNATGVNVTATVKVWEMNSAFIQPFPLDQM